MNRTTINVVITLGCFLAYYFAFGYFGKIMQFIDVAIRYRLLSYVITYFIIGAPVFFGTYLINRNIHVFADLGLSKSLLQGIVPAVLFTIPMFTGGLVMYKFNTEIILNNLVAGTIVAAFFEELYFRGFLFGQIFKCTKLGFIPSTFIGATVFAAAHLYQSREFATMAGIFITTFLGSVFFAWLFVEWNYNLWVPVFLHTLMNLSWSIFNISDNALGNMTANIFRGLTIAVAIILTILYKRKHGQKLLINRNNLFRKF